MNRYSVRMACLVVPFLIAGLAQAEEDARTIYVSGTSEIQLEPDYIEWRIELRDMGIDPVNAKAKNDERYAALLKLAKKLDIERDDLIVSAVSIDRRRERNKQGKYEFVGYVVEREVLVIQRDLKAFDEMLESLAAFKAEFYISYGSTKLRETKRKAQLEAVKAAREKAQAIASVLGQKVGRPLMVADHDTARGFDLRDALSNTAGGEGFDGGDGNARYGSITVRSGVDIRFELLDD